MNYLRPDGKTQVTVEYDEDNRPVRIDTVVHLHPARAGGLHWSRSARILIRRGRSLPVIPAELNGRAIPSFFINPTGRFVIGGPQGDSGLTGRKIIVDTYGGSAPHGGGAFSGKDPTKVDRSAAYAARYVAKNIVAAGLAHRCQVQLAYAIGVAQPVSVHGGRPSAPARCPTRRSKRPCKKVFDLRPTAIIRDLDLRTPHLPPARRLRPHGTRGSRRRLGKDRPHRSAEKGRTGLISKI